MAQQIINLGTLADGSDGDTNKVAWGKAKDNFAELYSATADGATTLSKLAPDVLGRLVGKGYISGLQMKWVSGTALTLTSGAAYIEGTGAVLFSDSDIAKTGLSLSASTWYHAYVYDNAGTPDFVLSTTAPATAYNGTARSMTGDTSKRYVGSVKTDASSALIQFIIDSGGDFRYLISNSSAPLRALSNGKATARTTVSLAGAMPVTATHAILQASNLDTSLFANMSNPFAISAAVAGIAAGGIGAGVIITFPTDSLQRVDYYYTTTPASGLYLDVIGFQVER